MLDYQDCDPKIMNGKFRDWRKALRAPTTYRIGNTVRMQSQFVMFVSIIGLFTLIIFYYFTRLSSFEISHKWAPSTRIYNNTYPLTPPLISSGVYTYRIGIVADLDVDSKVSKAEGWTSNFKKGYLSYNPQEKSVVVSWDNTKPITLQASYSLKGRGMELSELLVFDGRLLTFDDRTGLVYEIYSNQVIPWVILMDGNGKTGKGFKSEWATVRDDIMYVGSMGKEWTTPSGQFQSHDPMWIKAINVNGEVQHHNWVKIYKAIRSAIGIEWPGYLIHESAVWSPHKQRWFFLPRRCSLETYNETKDEMMGCNYLITLDSAFSNVKAKQIVPLKKLHGFSSFKFVPGSNDEVIVALRTTEHEGSTATYIMAFTIDGHILMKETFVADSKYEGLEFI